MPPNPPSVASWPGDPTHRGSPHATRWATRLCVAMGLLAGLGAGCGLGGLSEGLYEPPGGSGAPANRPDLTTCHPDTIRCVDDSGRYEVCGGAGEIIATGQCSGTELCDGLDASRGPCLPLENTCEGGEPLRLSPGTLSFKDAQTFKVVRRTVLLTNCGPEWMQIGRAEVIGRPAFALEDDPTAPWQTGRSLEPGEVVAVRVLYHPSPYVDSEQGELRLDVGRALTADGPALHHHELRIPLTGRAADTLPPPMAEPEPVDFGFVTVGQTRAREVLLRNNGAVPIHVEWVDVERLGTGQGELDLMVPERFEIAPAEVLAVPARFAAVEPGPMEARYRLWVKPWPADLDRPVVVLRGTAVADSGCEMQPVPRLTARDLRTDEIADDWIEVEPMSRLRLDPSGSYAQLSGATITHHQLTLLEAPFGSSAQLLPLTDSPDSPERELLVDVAGEYRVGLDVLDDAGQASCVRHVLRVMVRPRAALHAELVWTTPGDPSRTDTGTGAGADLDLHLVRESVAGDPPIPHTPWVSDPNDCFWLNAEPDWGSPRHGADDCHLLRDDRDGWGPELLALGQAESRGYTLLVHSLEDWGYGASLATVNIYLGGDLRYSTFARPLREGQTWRVATIHPQDGLIDEIDVVEEP